MFASQLPAADTMNLDRCELSDHERMLLEDCAQDDPARAKLVRGHGLGSATFAMGQAESILKSCLESPSTSIPSSPLNRICCNLEDDDDVEGVELDRKERVLETATSNIDIAWNKELRTKLSSMARYKFLLGLVNTSELSSDQISYKSRTQE
jgi:hypothetical protein